MTNTAQYQIIRLADQPGLKDRAAQWFSEKWSIQKETYQESIEDSFESVVPSWYVCLDGEEIIAGMGVIENDFHDRKDLTPNVCAVYTEEAHRKKGIAGRMLNIVVEDMRAKGVSPLYLLTDHIGFYERYGWEFLCMVQGDGEPEMSRMYIHR
ncbi:MAG: GNAT family N-acetyltransferase [Bacteroidia bacterium]|nr:GNAT family N-acetyltransferase [Bacteroidia bacterium]